MGEIDEVETKRQRKAAREAAKVAAEAEAPAEVKEQTAEADAKRQKKSKKESTCKEQPETPQRQSVKRAEGDVREDLPKAKKSKKAPENECRDADDLTVFIRGLPFTVAEDTLRKDFIECGEIQSIKFPRNQDGTPRGF